VTDRLQPGGGKMVMVVVAVVVVVIVVVFTTLNEDGFTPVLVSDKCF